MTMVRPVTSANLPPADVHATIARHMLADGFEFEGRAYPSLSAVARAITGSHCNGFLFFRMAGKGGGR